MTSHEHSLNAGVGIADYVVDTGSANAYAIAYSPAIEAYTAGQRFVFKAIHANTGASTLAVNGLSAIAITKAGTNVLGAGDIQAGMVCVVEHDGTEFQLISTAFLVPGSNGNLLYSEGGELAADGAFNTDGSGNVTIGSAFATGSLTIKSPYPASPVPLQVFANSYTGSPPTVQNWGAGSSVAASILANGYMAAAGQILTYYGVSSAYTGPVPAQYILITTGSSSFNVKLGTSGAGTLPTDGQIIYVAKVDSGAGVATLLPGPGGYNFRGLRGLSSSLPLSLQGQGYTLIFQASTTTWDIVATTVAYAAAGSNTDIQFNSAGITAGNGNLTTDGAGNLTMSGTLTAAAGTITTSLPGEEITQTWNNANATFETRITNITPTAYATGSRVESYQNAGTEVLGIDVTGSLNLDGTISNVATNLAPLRSVSGAGNPAGMAVDLVNNEIALASGQLIYVYSRTAVAGASPLRTISGSSTGLSSGTTLGLYIDNVNNEIGVYNSAGTGSILVFSRTANGNVAPLRTISGATTTITSNSFSYGLAVDTTNNEILLGNNGNGLVFSRTASGNVAPLRSFFPNGANGVDGVAIDLVNNQYITSDFYGGINVVSRTANGTVQPIRSIVGSNIQVVRPTGVAVDNVNNEIICTSANSDGVYIFNLTANGNVAPLRMIIGPSSNGLLLGYGVYVDTTNNEIGVTHNSPGSFSVFSRTWTSLAISGNEVLSGNLTVGGSLSVGGLVIDSLGDLTTAGSVNLTGLIKNSSTNLSPLRTIAPLPSGNPYGIYVDTVNNEIGITIGNSVVVYGRTSGTLLRTISGSSTTLNSPFGLYVDTTNNEIGVVNEGANAILIFSRTASGNVAPTRTLSGAATTISTPRNIAVDLTNNEIIVANLGNVLAFSRTASGNTAPLRSFLPSGASSAFDVYVDPTNNEIGMADYYSGYYIVSRTATGTPTALRSVPMSVGGAIAIAVDLTNNEIIVAGSVIEVFSRTGNGSISPLRSISGPATTLTGQINWSVYVDPTNNEIGVPNFENPAAVAVFSRTWTSLAISGNEVLSGNLTVGGDVNIGGSEGAGGTLTLTGSGNISGGLTLGTALTVAMGGTGLSTLTAKGAIPVATAATTMSALQVGTNGQCIQAASGQTSGLQYSYVPAGLYGNGTDGAVTYDGTTTILGMAPSSSIYTLTRDIYCTTIQVNTGVTINTANFRIFASVSVNLSGTAIIANNGPAGSGSAAGTAVAAGTLGAGGNGGAGGTTAVAGTGTTIALGGAGGIGGVGTSATAAGAAGTATVPTAIEGGIQGVYSLANAINCYCINGTAVAKYVGGGGGGGGSVITTAADAGGGGAGAGGMLICSPSITVAASASITCNGGNGGNASALNGGAGGGGGGGFIILVYANGGYTNSGTVTASGGTHGTANGTGGTGASGSAGVVVQIAN